MEVPGLKKDDIQIYRQNVKTIIKGNKLKPYEESDIVLEKQERSYGDF
jgi:HSP20 family molecular chaperone IbpA